MINDAFQNLFVVIPYDFFVGVMGVVIIVEFLYTIFENFDVL